VRIGATLAFSLLVLGQAGPAPLRVPDPDIGVLSLAARAAAQQATVSQFKVPYQFQFQDRVQESGIRFVHRIVDDAGRFYKGVHYDHGTGISVADVDGDAIEDLYFVNQLGGSELWKNLGGGKFTNITSAAGVALANKISVASSFADVDNDGDQDLFVTTVRGGNVLFENDGRGRFKNVSRAAGVDYVGHSSGAVFFDYDNDGLLDLYVCNVGRYTTNEKGRGGAYVGVTDAFSGHLHGDRAERSILYRNLGRNRFRNVTDEAGLGPAGWSGDASVGDVNGDGRPDLYVLNMQGADHYYENVGGRTFADKTSQYFPRTPWGSMGIKFFDYDNDGRADLLITDMHSDMSVEVGPAQEKLKAQIRGQDDLNFYKGGTDKFILGNALFRNLGAGKFEEISDRMGAETYWPWGPSVGDLNADGWQDVFIAGSMNYPFRYGINSLLLNNRGEKFLDSEFLLRVEPRRGGRTHTPWFEVDCSDRNSPSVCKGRTGKTMVMATLGSRSSAIFDLDQDGDLDIVTNDFNSEPQVFVSDLAERRQIRWLSVVPVGAASNRNGLGAAVRVIAGGQVLAQWNDGKWGYLSQSVLPLYFGLGDATSVDRVEVDWPSGRKQVVTEGIRVNSTLRVTEPRP
jgi:enediyne biosynthesis protein E4